MTSDPDGAPLGPRMCQVCHLIPSPLEQGGKIHWTHGLPVGHEPVVGPLVDPDLRCDFCSAPDPKWNAECAPFRMQTQPLGFDLTAQDDGAWACCDACASYLRRKDWPRLLYRATKAFPAPAGFPVGDMIARMHDEFRHHYTGTITPLQAHRSSHYRDA